MRIVSMRTVMKWTKLQALWWHRLLLLRGRAMWMLWKLKLTREPLAYLVHWGPSASCIVMSVTHLQSITCLTITHYRKLGKLKPRGHFLWLKFWEKYIKLRGHVVWEANLPSCPRAMPKVLYPSLFINYSFYKRSIYFYPLQYYLCCGKGMIPGLVLPYSLICDTRHLYWTISFIADIRDLRLRCCRNF